MKYDFIVKKVPENRDITNIAALTEGQLVVFVDGKTVFSEDGILLVELAISLSKWADPNNRSGEYPKDLYYASIDFEEEPILALIYKESKKRYIFDSVWKDIEYEIAVDRIDAIKAAQSYIDELSKVLFEQYDIDLEPIIVSGKRWRG